MKVIIKVVFESNLKAEEKWRKSGCKKMFISPKKTCNLRTLFINIKKKDKFVTEENISGC